MTDAHPPRRLDRHRDVGFVAANGLFDVGAGVAMLAAGVPAGWACMVIGCGAALLAGAVMIARDIEVAPGADAVVAAAVGVVLASVAILYLTHTAEDLPRLAPGHDPDSQHRVVTYGLALALGAFAALRTAYARRAPGARSPR